MTDIFEQPLALRMRPKTLDEFEGQDHIVGEGKLLRRVIAADRISSLIFFGPPGTGKTALAHVIANTTDAHFEMLNAVTAGVDDIRRIIKDAKERSKQLFNKKTILFIDEIHRFNKLQQDALLPDVEEGTIILIGATTHNPFFSVISALVSRSQIFELKPLTKDNIRNIIKRALKDERGLKKYDVKIDKDALEFLSTIADGDARKALSALEIGVLSGSTHYTLKAAEESIQKKAVVYDGNEDGHYDTISAFIKSMRGSDPDAALYWLAKMIYAGEDPRFIARRIVICASEDVGNADPRALQVAVAAYHASEFIGMPEARINLAQAAVYVACAPKSNASYIGIEKALEDIKNGVTMEVPDHLKGTGYAGAKGLGRGIGYKYAHDYKDHYVKQDYTPTKKKYYEPTEQGYEKYIKERLDKLQ